jgi:hypothetical protein
MAEEDLLKVNPNTADERTLQQLPGVGRSLAKKIVDSRPFSEVEDLLKIRGLGKAVLEQITPHLVLEEPQDQEEAGVDEEALDLEMLEDLAPDIEPETSFISPDGQKEDDLTDSQLLYEAQDTAEAVVPEVKVKKVDEKKAPVPAKGPRLVRAFSRMETIWLVVAVGVLTLILSVLMSLGILSGINGTLDFGQLQAVKQLESEVSVLEENLESLSSGLDAIDQRLTPLEGLTGRMTTVEDLVETVRGDVEDAIATVELMQSDLDDLSVETARLSGRIDLFDTFLDGLRRLMNEIFALPSPESLPES